MANAYANLKTIKSVSLLDIAGSSHDSRLLELLEDVSRWVDQHCNRHFFSLQATRAFDVEGGSSRLLVPDLIRITALKSDSDGDNRFEMAWASGDYRLYPLNAEPNQPWGRPYSRIEVGSGGGGSSRRAAPLPRGQERGANRGCVGLPRGVAHLGSSGGWQGCRLIGRQFRRQRRHALQRRRHRAHRLGTAIRHCRGHEHADGGARSQRHPGRTSRCLLCCPSLPLPCRGGRGLPSADGPNVEAQGHGLWHGCATLSALRLNGDLAGLDPDVRRMLSPYRRPAV